MVGDEFEQQRLLGVNAIVVRSRLLSLIAERAADRQEQEREKATFVRYPRQPCKKPDLRQRCPRRPDQTDRSVGKNRALTSGIAP
ncbi:MAG: hypothetical protein JWM91_2609 [Rhodospirillales bacterium]|nr:hypothetical protein [Rhodospirillales bacterium]